ncbi:hypothetical protein GCM10007111_43970 [Virgibacillus kapii]|uniref:Uncharacterized protein n=1 Tax=Virgibacillus kapii TaxID=1638645 RepID=A0ABQ2E2D5_9BACI|nr:hypothetical protein GCM10007111_43970 [Virgibacillus kapii]
MLFIKYRRYYGQDVIVLKKLVEIKRHADMTLKQATNAVVSRINQFSISGSDTSDK